MKKLLPIILLVFTLSFTACRKDETCTVNVRIVDANDVNVGAGYMVVFDHHRNLQPPGNSTNLPVQLATDAAGKVSVDFALPAIIEARVYAPGATDFSVGAELVWVPIKLEPGETTPYKIVLP